MTYLATLLRALDLAGPPLTNDGLAQVLAAHDRNIAAYIDQRAERVARHGGKASARQLRAASDDVRNGMYEGEEE